MRNIRFGILFLISVWWESRKRKKEKVALPAVPSPTNHSHTWKYAYTNDNFWDGDEEDIYRCECGETKKEYIPR